MNVIIELARTLARVSYQKITRLDIQYVEQGEESYYSGRLWLEHDINIYYDISEDGSIKVGGVKK